MSELWWWPSSTSRLDRPVLFFPPAGADQTVVTPLLAHLGGVRLGVLRLPGRGPRRDEPPPSDLGLLVDEIATNAARLDGPAPMLVGHSFGGTLAYAVAHALGRRARPPARLVVVASSAPHVRARIVAETGAVDEDDYVERRTRRLLADGAVPPEIAAHPELGELARATLATDVRLSCRAVDERPVRCPVTVVRAKDDPLVDDEGVAAWRRATAGGVDEVTVSGGHFFYRSRPQVLGRLLRGELSQLDGSYHAV